jgi:hypothetical protein
MARAISSAPNAAGSFAGRARAWPAVWLALQFPLSLEDVTVSARSDLSSILIAIAILCNRSMLSPCRKCHGQSSVRALFAFLLTRRATLSYASIEQRCTRRVRFSKLSDHDSSFGRLFF